MFLVTKIIFSGIGITEIREGLIEHDPDKQLIGLFGVGLYMLTCGIDRAINRTS